MIFTISINILFVKWARAEVLDFFAVRLLIGVNHLFIPEMKSINGILFVFQ